jgi:hypothetical protein
MEKGFYKIIEDLIYAPNRVQHKDFDLKIEDKDIQTYPVHGWYYFDTKEEAETFFISQGWEKPEE